MAFMNKERQKLADDSAIDPFTFSIIPTPLLAELYTASVQGRIVAGPQAGNYLATVGFQVEPGKSES